MNKAKIERMARDKRKTGGAAACAPDDPQSAQERAGARVVILDSSSVAALSGAILEGMRAMLMDIGPTLARLAAVDTLHTLEKPATSLKRGIDEGDIARALMNRGAI